MMALAVCTSRYTGKERDTESGLDDFGARYYSSSMGRFMSPDWSFAPEDVPFADFSDPQSMNLYSYARNNPLSGGDPSGHTYTVCAADNGQCTNIDDKTFEAEQKADKANGVGFANGNITQDGKTVGTFSHDPDIAGDPAANIAGMGYIGAHQAMVTEFVKQDAYFAAGALGGAAIGAGVEAIQAARAARIAAAVAKLSMVKPLVSNAKLVEVVEELFQVTDKIPGGLGGGVRYEAMTGDLLSPAGHAQEAGDIINQLNNILKNPNAGLSSRDQAIAKEIIGDLQRALGGK
jgi:RHS repeat-associated protein